ncbi:hypothetical protein [Bremerella cremea]|nr:hypothetical protein [Bremerella cremea]
MINLSNELMRLSTYLEETEEVADQEFNHYAAQNAYRHRIEAAARMAQNIAITNVTLGNDWLAVASADTATAIDRKYAAFRSQIEDVQELERLQQTNATSQANVSIPIENRIAEIEQRMLARQDSIPKIPVRQVAQKAVIANQQIDEASDNRQSGYLTLSVVRDLFIATGSGTLQPHMTSVPSIHVELIKSPPEVDTKSLLIRPGTGTTYDFNITLKSTAFNVFVPKGDYRFRYEAVCSDGELDSVNNEASVSNSKEEAPN